VATINRAANILWNVYRFPLPYMILDTFEPASEGGAWDDAYITVNLPQMPDEDRFIISRINSVALTVDAAVKECQLHRATRELVNFVLEDLSRWYVQLVRPRMWLEGESQQKVFAYETIYYVMRRLAGLLAPFCPHLSEEIYQNLRCRNDPPSIHLLDWDAGDPALVDSGLEDAVGIIRSFDDASANARQAGKRKLRWPVAEVVVVTGAEHVKAAIDRLNAVCRDRANARKVTVVLGRWDRIGWHAEPLMKALGPGFGKNSPKVRKLIGNADANFLKAEIDAGRTVALTDADGTFTIGAEHVAFTEKLPAGVFSAPMPDATVYVDVQLTPDLEAEGYAREVIRRIQEMRRQLDLAVEDFIVADTAVADERVCALIRDTWRAGIMDEVRARSLSIHNAGDATQNGPSFQLVKDWDVEGIAMTIGVSRATD
jgi:isoleucyl-tRNA synthetase